MSRERELEVLSAQIVKSPSGQAVRVAVVVDVAVLVAVDVPGPCPLMGVFVAAGMPVALGSTVGEGSIGVRSGPGGGSVVAVERPGCGVSSATGVDSGVFPLRTVTALGSGVPIGSG